MKKINKPYYENENIILFNMNSLNGLKLLDQESIDCIITSPPYWCQRDYEIDDYIWDEKKDCKHEWGINYKINSSGGKKSIQENNKGSWFNNESNFCIKCGAWRGQLGLEPTFDLYIDHLCSIFDECKRVLKSDGTCWVVIGDSYFGSNKGIGTDINNTKNSWIFQNKIQQQKRILKNKCLCQIPSRFAIEMCNRGWILRNEIIWFKPNAMPQSVKDRFTVDFEKVFFFVKNKKYYFKTQFEKIKFESLKRQKRAFNLKNKPYAIKIQKKYEGYKKINEEFQNHKGRNKRTVWAINTKPFTKAHFAVFPEKLIIPMIKAGCKKNGIILDPFMGSGTTGKICIKLNRRFIGFDPNKNYCNMAIDDFKYHLAKKENKFYIPKEENYLFK